MIIVRDIHSIQHISDIAIRELVQQRIDDLGGDDFDSASLGYILVVQSGDTLEALNAQLGFDPLCNRLTDIRHDQSGFAPWFEFVEEFPSCFDAVFILSDDGFGVELFISKAVRANQQVSCYSDCVADGLADEWWSTISHLLPSFLNVMLNLA